MQWDVVLIFKIDCSLISYFRLISFRSYYFVLVFYVFYEVFNSYELPADGLDNRLIKFRYLLTYLVFWKDIFRRNRSGVWSEVPDVSFVNIASQMRLRAGITLNRHACCLHD